MQTKLSLDGEFYVVSLIGQLDYDSAEPFRANVLGKLTGKKVIFNLSDLDFVGSCGITDFVQTIADLVERTEAGVRMVGVSAEFKRIFETRVPAKLQILETLESAKTSFDPPPMTIEPMKLDRVNSGRPEIIETTQTEACTAEPAEDEPRVISESF